IANVLFNSLGLCPYIVPGDLCLPGTRLGNTDEHFHRCGLSRPVGPQKTKDLPFCNLKTDGVYRGQITEFVGETIHLYDVVIFHYRASSIKVSSIVACVFSTYISERSWDSKYRFREVGSKSGLLSV